ncbi:MAG: hypothetical protein NTV94_08615 [Planctomycetota bacterium]|nr:hypothetical protein [Planctomycetota bacterium]
MPEPHAPASPMRAAEAPASIIAPEGWPIVAAFVLVSAAIVAISTWLLHTPGLSAIRSG